LAELFSGVGAAVTGRGVGAALPDPLRPLAVHVLLVGITVHLVGMTAKRRLEREATNPAWVVAAYWACVTLLAGLAVFAVGRLL
jgi:hypothetical protein